MSTRKSKLAPDVFADATMNDKPPFYQDPFFWTLLALTYGGNVLLDWLARRTPVWQEGRLTLRQHVGFLLTPLGLFVACFLFDHFVVALPRHWWFLLLSSLVLLTRPYLFTPTARNGAPLKMRQAAHQVAYGVILCFVVLVCVAYLSEWLSGA